MIARPAASPKTLPIGKEANGVEAFGEADLVAKACVEWCTKTNAVSTRLCAASLTLLVPDTNDMG
jgi:hypothetical protein